MSSLLGVYRLGLRGNRTSNDDLRLANAQRRFPSSFLSAVNLERNNLHLLGHFQEYADGNTSVYLFGEVYNCDEIVSDCSLQTSGKNTAFIIHQLIAAQGIDAIKKVNGQFVVFYYEHSINKLSIVNDHLGVQQLLYHYNGEMLLFGSEVKLLLAHPGCPRGVDWETGLKRHQPNVVLGSYKSYNTWFNGVKLLPEASILEIDLETGDLSLRKYWRTDDINPSPTDTRTADQVMTEYAALLDDAVKIRIQDMGTACSLLSGGLDSSAICGLAAKHGPLETFSIINQTTVLEGTTTFCHTMAKELNFSNTQFLVPYHELCFDATLWQQRVWRAESPVNHTDSLTKTLLHYAIHQHHPEVTHILTGTGSDQLNGGFIHYVVPDSGNNDENWSAFLDAITDTNAKLLIDRSEEQLWQMRKFVNGDYLSAMSGRVAVRNPWHISMDGAIHSQAFSLLWDEQRASSAHGHTTRYPFLDFRIAEFTAAIPVHLHSALFNDKQILRKPAADFVPDYIINKPKKPYELPEYDVRTELYNALTQDNDNSLFTAAFGDLNTPHPVIDKKRLYSRIVAMRNNPEIIEWQNIMHIINLGILEQLADKDETDLAYELSLTPPEHILFDDPNGALSFLNKRLNILTADELIDRPLKFGTGCTLVHDTKNKKYYLTKRNSLLYEIEPDYADWKLFLEHIDDRSSTRAILEHTGVAYSDIEEFFLLCLKEQILVINNKQTGY